MFARIFKLLLIFGACWAVYQYLLNPTQRREWGSIANQIAMILIGASLLALLSHLLGWG